MRVAFSGYATGMPCGIGSFADVAMVAQARSERRSDLFQPPGDRK